MLVWQSLRSFSRQRRLAVLVSLSVAVGVAASASVLAIYSRLILATPIVPHWEKVATIDYGFFRVRNSASKVGVVDDLSTPSLFEAIGLFQSGGLNIGEGPEARRVNVTLVDAGFFQALGVQAAMGRHFGQNDDQREPNIVLSDRLWRDSYKANPQMVGERVRLHGRLYTVIGIMPPAFSFPNQTEAWLLPLIDRQATGGLFVPTVLVRLAAGREVLEVQDFLRKARVRRTAPPVEVTPFRQRETARLRQPAQVVLLLALFVWVSTTANITGLLLTSIMGRRRELVVRSLLGASERTVWRQVTLEGSLMVILGILVAAPLVRSILIYASSVVPELRVDPYLFTAGANWFAAFSIVCLLVVAVVSSSATAQLLRRAQHIDLGAATSQMPAKSSRIRHGLVLAQVSLGVIACSAAGTLAVQASKLLKTDLGFGDSRVFAELSMPAATYQDAGTVNVFLERLDAELNSRPGVIAAGLSNLAPGSSGFAFTMPLEPQVGVMARATDAQRLAASPGFFAAAGIQMVAGRSFNSSERQGVVIVSQGAAEALFGRGVSAVGRHLKIGDSESAEIIGVVRETLLAGPGGAPRPQVYFPLLHLGARDWVGIALSHRDPRMGLQVVRDVIQSINPELPMFNARDSGALQASFLSTERTVIAVALGTSLIILVLFSVGLYGVLSGLVARRQNEIALRQALGASRSAVLITVMSHGVRLTSTGVALGIGCWYLLLRANAGGLLPAHAEWSPIAASALVLLLAGGLASLGPALVALRIHPARLLGER